jgi:hypothetical protein
MSRLSKSLDQILRGGSDANVDFHELRNLLDALGFREHIRGSHHIFTRAGIVEIINLRFKGKALSSETS